MGYTLKKRELVMIAVLIAVLYIFVLYQFSLKPSFAPISDVNTRIDSLKKQKAVLDEKVKNMESRKAELKSKSAYSERVSDYLLETANITDGVDLIENMSKIINKDMNDISITKPEEVKLENAQVNGTKTQNNGDQAKEAQKDAGKYYKTSIGCKVNLTLGEALDLVNYIDTNTKKLTLSKFNLKPVVDKNNQSVQKPTTPQQPVNQGDALNLRYDLEMTINFYSMNIGTMNKMYNYTNGKFNQFKGKNTMPFAKPIEEKDGIPKPPPDISDSGQKVDTGNKVASNVQYEGSDVVVYRGGYLGGGDNFLLFAMEKVRKTIRITTKGTVNVKLSFDDKVYKYDAYDIYGVGSSFSGNLPDKDIDIWVETKRTNAKEDENVKVDISVVNSSKRAIRLKMHDEASKVRVLDRNGNVINSKSEIEKTYLI